MNHKWNFNWRTELGELVFENKAYIILTGVAATDFDIKYNLTQENGRDALAESLAHTHRASVPGDSQRAAN